MADPVQALDPQVSPLTNRPPGSIPQEFVSDFLQRNPGKGQEDATKAFLWLGANRPEQAQKWMAPPPAAPGAPSGEPGFLSRVSSGLGTARKAVGEVLQSVDTLGHGRDPNPPAPGTMVPSQNPLVRMGLKEPYMVPAGTPYPGGGGLITPDMLNPVPPDLPTGVANTAMGAASSPMIANPIWVALAQKVGPRLASILMMGSRVTVPPAAAAGTAAISGEDPMGAALHTAPGAVLSEAIGAAGRMGNAGRQQTKDVGDVTGAIRETSPALRLEPTANSLTEAAAKQGPNSIHADASAQYRQVRDFAGRIIGDRRLTIPGKDQPVSWDDAMEEVETLGRKSRIRSDAGVQAGLDRQKLLQSIRDDLDSQGLGTVNSLMDRARSIMAQRETWGDILRSKNVLGSDGKLDMAAAEQAFNALKQKGRIPLEILPTMESVLFRGAQSPKTDQMPNTALRTGLGTAVGAGIGAQGAHMAGLPWWIGSGAGAALGGGAGRMFPQKPIYVGTPENLGPAYQTPTGAGALGPAAGAMLNNRTGSNLTNLLDMNGPQ